MQATDISASLLLMKGVDVFVVSTESLVYEQEAWMEMTTGS